MAGLLLGVVPSSAARAPSFEPGPTITLAETEGARDLAVARNGRFALVATDDNLQRVDLTKDTSRVARVSSTVWGDQVVIAPNGSTAYVVADYEYLHVVDLRQGRVAKVRTLRRTQAAPSAFKGMAIAPDGKHLYLRFGSTFGEWGSRQGIQVLSLRNPRKPVKAAVATGRPRGVDLLAYAAGTKKLVTTDRRGRVVIFRAAGAKVRQQKVIAIPFEARSIAVAPNGRRAWIASSVTPTRIVEVDLRRNRAVKTRRYPAEPVADSAVTHDGRFLYVTFQGTTSEPTFAVLRTSDGKDVLAGDGTLYPPAVADVPRGPFKGRILVVHGLEIGGGRPPLTTLDR